MLTREEVEKHNSRESCWIAIHGSVYDITGISPLEPLIPLLISADFLDSHPGGPEVILRCAGKDATDDFDAVHDIQLLNQSLPSMACLGRIDSSTLAKSTDHESSAPLPNKNIPPPVTNIINLHDFEEVAKKHLSPNAWAYYSSGADDESTKRENAQSYQHVLLRPRILRNIPAVDTTTTILGHHVSLPVYISAVGLAKLAHPEGECALARAAGKEGLAQVLANGSSIPIENVRESRVNDDQPLFCQLYVNRDIRRSEEYIRRAEKTGASAIWLTVDSPVVGKREMDERVNLAVQVYLHHVSTSFANLFRPVIIKPAVQALPKPGPALFLLSLTGTS